MFSLTAPNGEKVSIKFTEITDTKRVIELARELMPNYEQWKETYSDVSVVTLCEAEYKGVVCRGAAFCSVYDEYRQNKGEKQALARSLHKMPIDKSERAELWKQFLGRRQRKYKKIKVSPKVYELLQAALLESCEANISETLFQILTK